MLSSLIIECITEKPQFFDMSQIRADSYNSFSKKKILSRSRSPSKRHVNIISYTQKPNPA